MKQRVRISTGRSLMCTGLLGLALLISACGGGGGQPVAAPPPPPPPPAPPPPPPPPPPSPFETAEFRNNQGLASINVLPAYEDGLTGEGVTVAVVDSGIDVDHFDLADNIDPRSTNIITGNPDDLGDPDGHGTNVAGVIAALKNDDNSHGVAFNAKILALRADDPGSCAEDDGCSFFDRDIAIAIDFAIASGVRIINLSLGSDDPGVAPSLLRALQDAAAAGAIIVIAAANDSVAAHLSGLAGTAADPLIDGHVIVAGALTTVDELASFSNFAGTTVRDFFLGAPGTSIRTTGLNDTMNLVAGTSFAAPHIAGAIALLWEKFPNLSASEIVEILYASAVDLGDEGIDSIFGNGKLDVGAALAPIGTVSVPMGQTTAGLGLDIRTSSLRLGPAFGDALAGQELLSNAVVLDSFQRAYAFDLQSLVGVSSATPDLSSRARYVARRQSHLVRLSERRSFSISVTDEQDFANSQHHLDLRESLKPRYRNKQFSYTAALGERASVTMATGGRFSNPGQFSDTGQGPGDMLSRAATRSPFTAFVERDSSVMLGYRLDERTEIRLATIFGQSGETDDPGGRRRSFGNIVQIDREFRTGASLGLELGAVSERGGFLGTRASGAFEGAEGAWTFFAGLSASYPVGAKWLLFGHLSQGFTRIDETGFRLLGDFSTIRAGAFGFGATTSGVLGAGDWLTLGLSQPLRVAKAAATLTVATGRDFESEDLIRESQRIGLVPSGREIDFEIAYGFAAMRSFTLQSNFLYQMNPGHTGGAPSAMALFLEIKSTF